MNWSGIVITMKALGSNGYFLLWQLLLGFRHLFDSTDVPIFPTQQFPEFP